MKPPLALIDSLRIVIDYVEATRGAGRSRTLYLLLEEIAAEIGRLDGPHDPPAPGQARPTSRPKLVIADTTPR